MAALHYWNSADSINDDVHLLYCSNKLIVKFLDLVNKK